jgi:hypothetical protein
MESVIANLLQLYLADTAQRWLIGLNPHLGFQRPIDLVRIGRKQEVLDAIAQERAGSFA